MSTVISIEEFRRVVAAEVGRDPESIPYQASLRGDVGLDSVEMFLLLIAVEDLGVFFPEEMLAHVVTIEDAYHHFVTQSGHR
jgi:acyl carrier protein